MEKDIGGFIKEQGTGQEIPDPPKFINFCRGDLNDAASEMSDDGNYSVAQFQRTMNPAFRTSSPQPSTFESHHDPESNLVQEMNGRQVSAAQANPLRTSQNQAPPADPYQDMPKVPHNEYPMDGMTQFCRIGPPSERSTIPSPTKEDLDDRSDYSAPTSYSSFEPSSGNQSPVKQFNESNISSNSDDRHVQKKKSGFFQNHSPFKRRASKHENQYSQSAAATPSSRNTWAEPSRETQGSSPTRPYGRANTGFAGPGASPDPDPVDPRANFQLNVGNNVFDVASPDSRKRAAPPKATSEDDPIAAALAELKGVTKNASVRVSADRYHGIATPAPSGTPGPNDRTPTNGAPRPFAGQELRSGHSGTPPPSYDQPVSRLGAPQPAFTSKQMKQTTANYVSQGRDMYTAGRQGPQEPRSQSAMGSRPTTRDGQIPRATSPAPLRSTSPRPYMNQDPRAQQQMRATSPNPYGRQGPDGMPPNGGPVRPRAQSSSPIKQQGGYGPGPYNSSPGQVPRARSPQPGYGGPQVRPGSRPPSSRGSDNGGGMALQLAPGGEPNYGGQRGRGSVNGAPRPTSQMYSGDGPYGAVAGSGANMGSRNRSQSAAGHRQVNKEGRPVLHFGKHNNSPRRNLSRC